MRVLSVRMTFDTVMVNVSAIFVPSNNILGIRHIDSEDFPVNFFR